MCSINGFTFKDSELIDKMNHITKHRGPDATNVFINHDISLGHNRLSVIDTREVANQPMISDGGRFVLIFNGEIYNFQEIKKDLSEYSFVTDGDTEVILKGFQKWGTGIFSKLNGMYAVAIWDTEKKELLLARDPQGIKPLYYSLQNNNLIFSSEIKAILEHSIERIVDMDAFNAYMSVLYVPAPLTMFKGVSKLEPGIILNFKDGVIKTENINYVSKNYNKINSKELEFVVDDAVKRQLISDRPVGVFLSGGIDSSVILDSASRIHKNIDTFTISFDLGDENAEEKFNVDAKLAKRTSELYKTNHHEIKVGVEDIIQSLDDVIYQLDEPNANPTVVPTSLLAKFAKEKVDVVLGGDGADELFAGYERYSIALASCWYQKIVPAVIRKLLDFNSSFKKLNTIKSIDKYELFHFQNKDKIEKVVNLNYMNDYSKKFFEKLFLNDSCFMNKFLLSDEKVWLVDESLMRSDKMSMLNSLEQRVPFLDLEVVAFAHKTPITKKINLFKRKIILRRAFKHRLPKYLFKQPKRGWFSPSAKWMRNPKFLDFIKLVLSEDYYPETRKLFNWDNIDKIIDDHVSGKVYNRSIIWALLTFQIWAKIYKIKIK